MQVEILQSGVLGTNSYVFHAEGDTDCAVTDPVDAKPVLALLEEKGLHCTHILLTHGHFDHTLGVAALREATGAEVYISGEDAAAFESGNPEGKKYAMWGYKIAPCPVVRLAQGDTLQIGALQVRAIHTPGHTPGGMCFLVEAEDGKQHIFAGDTLFRGSVGRFDLPGGDGDALLRSIREKLFTLPGDAIVYPGHGPATTLDFERAHNPFVLRAGGRTE